MEEGQREGPDVNKPNVGDETHREEQSDDDRIECHGADAHPPFILCIDFFFLAFFVVDIQKQGDRKDQNKGDDGADVIVFHKRLLGFNVPQIDVFDAIKHQIGIEREAIHQILDDIGIASGQYAAAGFAIFLFDEVA